MRKTTLRRLRYGRVLMKEFSENEVFLFKIFRSMTKWQMFRKNLINQIPRRNIIYDVRFKQRI